MKPTTAASWKFLAALAALVLLTSGCSPDQWKHLLAKVCDMATITVTKVNDTNDGWCDSMDCSLREAVIESNFCPGTQTIVIPAGMYSLTLAGTGEDAAATGDLDIKDNVTILGEDQPVINGDLRDRVFEVFPGFTADISGVIIQRGRAPYGGGIYNQGTLNINESTLRENTAVRPAGGVDPARGGAIFSRGSGALGVYLSTVEGNTAEQGGGILAMSGGGAAPTVMISHTKLVNNLAPNGGGGLWLGEDVDSTAIRFEVDGNSAEAGGSGIYNAGSLELTDGSIEDNTGAADGGGIYNDSAGTVIARQMLVQNNSGTDGGGIYNRGMTHFYNSALVTNTAAGEGGGAYNQGAGGGLLLNNTTVGGNRAGAGAGIRNQDGNFQFMFVTIAANNAEGINSSGAGETTMRNTILSANPGGNCAGTIPDSIGHNIDDANTCLLIEPSDLVNTDPMLQPLAMDGSIRPTFALPAGSPAIDSADPDRCDGTDQRLVDRPQGPNCDRGAYEREAAAGGSGSIGGTVWRELCALPDGPLPATPPPGCIPIGDNYEANGILEAGEPGIAGVHVRLGEGACPAVGAGLATTDAGGLYEFTGLAAGTYCVSIDALSGDNVPVLIPGGWSFPVREVTVAQAEIALGAGEIRSDVNFGWDFQFDAGWPDSSPTPTPALTATPTAALSQLAFGKPWISTDHFFYLQGGQCSPVEVKFQIEVSDPKLVDSVGMFFSLEDKASGERTGWSRGFAMNPLGNGKYFLTMPATEIPLHDSFAEAWLRYQFVANEKDWKPILYSDYFRDITLSRCGQPEVVGQTPTGTRPNSTPTPTTKSPNQTNK
jgi:CSLREA domain-containing protein